MTDEELAYYDALVAGEHSIAHLSPVDVRLLTGEVRRLREENRRLVDNAESLTQLVAVYGEQAGDFHKQVASLQKKLDFESDCLVAAIKNGRTQFEEKERLKTESAKLNSKVVEVLEVLSRRPIVATDVTYAERVLRAAIEGSK